MLSSVNLGSQERITGISRELLMQIKELAEGMDFEVLYGIVDCPDDWRANFSLWAGYEDGGTMGS